MVSLHFLSVFVLPDLCHASADLPHLLTDSLCYAVFLPAVPLSQQLPLPSVVRLLPLIQLHRFYCPNSRRMQRMSPFYSDFCIVGGLGALSCLKLSLLTLPSGRMRRMSGEEVSSNPVDTTYESASNIAMTRDTEAVGRTRDTATPEHNQNPEANEHENENQNENDNEAFQSKKRQKTSVVWLSFKEILVGTVKMAECIYCKARFRMASSGATSHLKRHADKCLRKPANLADKNQQQLSLAATINNAESVNAVQNFKYDHGKMRQVISHWIILTEKSLSTADHEMFTLMMKTANPLYQRVTRSTTTADVFSTYDIFKGKVKGLLKHVQRMSLSTDMWTSNQTMQYMVVTGHFIDKNWKLQKRILNFCGVPPPHTGIVLADALQKCLVAWDVESKIWSITLDNASNNDVAVRHLKSMLTYTRRLPLDGDLFHVRCGAHIINIMVQYGLKAIEDTIESVRQSVKHIAASEGRISMFRDIAKQLRLSPKKLILDCSTRWNSTHHMLSVALELKAVFPRYAERESGYKWLPSDEDWSKVGKVCKFLGLFSYITTIISGNNYIREFISNNQFVASGALEHQDSIE
ncbi:Zinc finger BED domain-containing protein RICESLEEPER 2 [Linum perenne]